LEDAEEFPYVAAIDCDYVNERLISIKSILTAVHFLSIDTSRAAVLANQRGFYYDVWALRHPIWCPGDCWQEVKAWCELGMGQQAAWSCVGSRQVHIPPTVPPIEVESGFGGFAIYKTKFLFGCEYRDFSEAGTIECEHVGLNRQIRSN